ncbi:hypothetical protein NM688_g8482 [Phlebia brevispora]|uniref:Uncharacterized protein n=1 Tax=Phlebia brevispora TaxID=194682 RepID=A0ACC1RS49_9APHY|nr:hypothetical protein NM688_g8482 [Phlebia brevispora]
MADTAASPSIPPSTTALILDSSPPNEPPPPYPSRERRRMLRAGRRRRTVGGDSDHHLQAPSASSEPEYEFLHGQPSGPGSSPFPLSDAEHEATETTPLLLPSNSPRLPPGGISGRQRTLSLTSTIHSVASIAPSFAHTVLSAFHPERDCDLDPDVGHECQQGPDSDGHDYLDSPLPRHPHDEHSRLFAAELANTRVGRRAASTGRWRRYFRPMTRRAYYSALFHLLLLNFPYALVAWVYLFVFTLTGTTTLMALPLGAVLCFLDLLGARTFARGELSLQTTFHGPLAFPVPYPPHPIFTRTHIPTAAELEAGLGPSKERSFYRNAYSMFTDSTSYQALFYFLVIKPGITVLLTLILMLLVPVSFALILPAPAMLRLVRRLGIWQANIAVEGLYYTVR